MPVQQETDVTLIHRICSKDKKSAKSKARVFEALTKLSQTHMAYSLISPLTEEDVRDEKVKAFYKMQYAEEAFKSEFYSFTANFLTKACDTFLSASAFILVAAACTAGFVLLGYLISLIGDHQAVTLPLIGDIDYPVFISSVFGMVGAVVGMFMGYKSDRCVAEARRDAFFKSKPEEFQSMTNFIKALPFRAVGGLKEEAVDTLEREYK